MNILFLDDNEDRIAKAQEAYKNAEVLSIARTAEQTIEFLKSGLKYELVHLDHDLGGERMVDSKREDCGMEVVRWIIRNNPEINVISIHSWNEPASKEMMLRLNAHKDYYKTSHYSYVFWIPYGLNGWDIGNRMEIG